MPAGSRRSPADRHGRHVEQASIHDLDIIDDVVDRLAAGGIEPFNAARIAWAKARLPFGRGTVIAEARFDAVLVPRGPADPIYEAAATARQRLSGTRTRGLPARE